MDRNQSVPPSADKLPTPEGNAANGMKFETAVVELEQIVQKMESGQLSLEESIAAYKRGSELLQYCQRQLSDAERQIQILENGTLRDFDTALGDGQ